MTNKTHGRGQDSSGAYNVWMLMRSRCLNKNKRDYPRYGGRGITVCERWNSFENFLADMGEQPAGMQIDRIDNNGAYSPGNCRWATPKQQARNRRSTIMVTLNGRTQPLIDWCDEFGARYDRVYQRIYKLGWDIERALTETKHEIGVSIPF